tara:strand:- start:539 stop:997 length:459 start_codon:yes stop_codon:yes gene_type:complete
MSDTERDNPATRYGKRLEAKGLNVRMYAGAHEQLYNAVSILHAQVCHYDDDNLTKFFAAYPGVQAMLNDWAEGEYATRDFPPEPPVPFFWCSDCHGTDVQTAAYVNLNTHEVADDYGSWNWMNGRYNYCSDCSDQVEILTEKPTTTPNRGAV